ATPSGSSVTSVSIDGGDRTVVVDDALTLTATVVTEGGASDALTWESSDEAVAVIDGAGSVTILTVGVVDVSATSTVDPSVRDTVTLTVDPLGVLAWTRQFGTSSDDESRGVATDASGNVYVVGFTDGVLEGDGAGGVDAFIRSFDSDGTLRWTRQFGTNGTDEAFGVATDANGNVYAVGRTTGTLEGTNAGGADVFVRSYDGGGTLRWTRQFGTSAFDTATGVATDANGNVYVTGRTDGALEGTGAGGTDAFIRSYDGNGDLRWTRQFGTSSQDFATGVATDAHSNVYVSGFTGGALEGTHAGAVDAFIRSYDGGGTLRWTRQFGTSGDDPALGVATDVNGNVYVTGYTAGELDGPSAGGLDAFIRSFDGDGTLRWARQFGTSSSDVAYDVATDASGHVYAAGHTRGALEGANVGGDDAFIRSYDGGGTLRWTHQFGTSSGDQAFGVATDASGGVYVAGYTLGALEGANAGGFDAFLRKHGR
ncbi:MAG: hypothetical protein EA416_00530, partial [Trueperaceae bacterium]